MSATTTVLGTLREDGTILLDQKPNLPPGRVQVIVQPCAESPTGSLLQRLQVLWEEQRARGYVPRSAEEVEEEREAVRNEWEERLLQFERIQEEGRQARLRGESSE